MTLVFLVIALLTFFLLSPTVSAITGVISSAAASNAARVAGAAQRPAPCLKNRMNPSLICALAPGSSWRGADPFRGSSGKLVDIGELLLQLKHRLEEVALLLDALDRVGNLEPELLGIAALRGPLHLAPVKRDRGGGALARPQRVDPDRRLLLVILAPVDEHLAAALGLRHLRDHVLRRLLVEQLGDRLGERAGLLVGDLRVEWEVDLEALAA